MIRKLAVALSLLVFSLGVSVSKPASATIPCSCEGCATASYCYDAFYQQTYQCSEYIGLFCS